MKLNVAHEPDQTVSQTAVASSVPFGTENKIFVLLKPHDNGGAAKFAKLVTQSTVSFDIAPPVLFTHLLKAGGSEMQGMLGSTFKMFDGYHRQSYLMPGAESNPNETKRTDGKWGRKPIPAEVKGEINDGVESLPVSPHTKYFRIGTTRNPCNYLISMWAFQSKKYDGHGTWPRECLDRAYGNHSADLYAKSGTHDSEEDIARFREWVRVTAGPFKKMHYLTYRSYMALHSEKREKGGWDDGQFFSCITDLSPELDEQISNKLLATDLSKRYECLIHTETMSDDYYACMKKYSEHIKDQSIKDKFWQVVERVANRQNPNLIWNKTPHGECKDYFDDATTAFVWEREGPYAKKVGYQKCCEKPTHLGLWWQLFGRWNKKLGAMWM